MYSFYYGTCLEKAGSFLKLKRNRDAKAEGFYEGNKKEAVRQSRKTTGRSAIHNPITARMVSADSRNRFQCGQAGATQDQQSTNVVR